MRMDGWTGVAFLGAWNRPQMHRAEEMVAILARLNVDVACVIQTEWGAMDVVTSEELRRHGGREHLLLADKYMMLLGQRAGV